MDSTDRTKAHRVVVVGGGIAALEAVLALHDLAYTQVTVTVIAPEPEFMLRPLDVGRHYPRGHPSHVPLAPFMAEHGGRFRRTAALSVDSELRTVHCSTGPDESYDALIIAIGASARPAFEHALTVGADLVALNELVADLEHGCSNSVAFVVPKGCSWPLPLYELALMAADEVGGIGMEDVQLHVVTPEPAPLDIFGPEASAAIEELLEAARIELHSDVNAVVGRGGRIDTGSGSGLDVDRVVALPVLDGPRLEGLPSNAHGFVPVDTYGRVVGVEAVYAAGDASDHPIKQGDLACQQADAVAAHVAAVAGAAADAVTYAPVLRGRLLTGHHDRVLRRAKKASADEVTASPLWWPSMRVSGRYLAPFLEARGVVEPPLHEENRSAGVDVRLSRSAGWSRVQSVTSTL